MQPEIVIEERIQDESWDELISMAMQAREATDNGTWMLGDLAVKVLKNYGPVTKDGMDTLDKFSANIGVSRNTLRRYKTVSQAWPPEKRDPYLSHRHHMILAPRKDRFDIIVRASDENWSTECLRKELKKMDGEWDSNLAAASMTFTKAEVEEILMWHDNLTNPSDYSEIVVSKVIKLHEKTTKER